MTTRVLIADDQSLVRHGFRMILDAEQDLEVVAEAADGERPSRPARASRRTSCSWTSGCRSWTGSRRPGASSPPTIRRG